MRFVQLASVGPPLAFSYFFGLYIYERQTTVRLRSARLAFAQNEFHLEIMTSAVRRNYARREADEIHQAALLEILTSGGFEACVEHVPCEHSNSCHQHWKTLIGTTRIIHVKGSLRVKIIDGDPGDENSSDPIQRISGISHRFEAREVPQEVTQ